MKLIPLPAFQDNYLWLLHDGRRAMVVDPGDALVVQRALAAMSLELAAILVTHHHPDHVGGVAALREATGAVVFGPKHERIPQPFTPVVDGDTLDALDVSWQVLDVPGHTAGHVAYFAEDVVGLPLLFCGDTLFSGGCGRLFEGTPAQMLNSLDRLAALPGATRVCCAHEYTLSNLHFALAVEPDNVALRHYHTHCSALRAQGLPTLPGSIATERMINPFLRVREPAVRSSALARDPAGQDNAAILGTLRAWKNEFR